MTRVRRMILLAASICLAQIGPAFRAAGQDNPTDGEREALPSTAYARALTNRPSYRNRKPPPPPPPSPGAGQVALTAALAIAGILSLRKVVPRTVDFLNSRFNHPLSSQQTRAEARLSLLTEDPGLSEFFCTLRTSLTPTPADGGILTPNPLVTLATPQAAVTSGKDAVPVPEFLASASRHVAGLRTLFSGIARAPDDSARLNTLLALLASVGPLIEAARVPELRPVWQIASALEGLLKQLTAKASNITVSTLRTVASLMDLLEAVCVPGLKPNLADEPPVRLLVVDDDSISRRAMSLALAKALPPPDLAENGEAGLKLALERIYDVIFLDVEMPGMDGFELCSKIHATVLNRTTPIVFVTSHSDFSSRAKSTLTGAQDLIAKPFLAFDITVKALTTALRGRLENNSATKPPAAGKAASDRAAVAGRVGGVVKLRPADDAAAGASGRNNQHAGAGPERGGPTRSSQDSMGAPKATGSQPEIGRAAAGRAALPDGNGELRPASAPASSSPPAASANITLHAPVLHSFSDGGSRSTHHPSGQIGDNYFPAPAEPSSQDYSHGLLTKTPAHLGELRNRLEAAIRVMDPVHLQELLGELHIGVHGLSLEAERAALRTVYRLGYTLEGMLKKLVEQPKLRTLSTLTAASAALALLEQLCRSGFDPNFAESPIRLLVVDDDPIARRAVCGALQLVFGRPDSADSGEAALALAAEKPYDLVFMDVLMPGMDGFTACSKIHETVPNRQTPVVFITSHQESDARACAEAAGGCGFIPKPVLSSEIMLTALTFVLRARLELFTAPERAQALAQAACCVSNH